jgi:hypothetical protein
MQPRLRWMLAAVRPTVGERQHDLIDQLRAGSRNGCADVDVAAIR